MKNPKVTLYLNSATDYSIVDGAGATYTIEEARDVYERGDLDDCNLSFRRLAEFDFDITRLREWYARFQ